MSFSGLFFTFRGRIGRLRWWIGTIVVEALATALSWLAGVPISGDPSTFRLRIIAFLIQLLPVYPTIALTVKRLHDRDYPGITALPLFAAFGVILVGNLFGYFDYSSSPPGLVLLLFMIIVFVIPLGYLFVLGFRRGDRGPNRYGPDPTDRTARTADA